jgi:NADH-quinone oxidoreductase subunit N
MLLKQLENLVQSWPLLQTAAWLSVLMVLMVVGGWYRPARPWIPTLGILGLFMGLWITAQTPNSGSYPMLGTVHLDTLRFLHYLCLGSGIWVLWAGLWGAQRVWTPVSSALLVMMVLGAHLALLASHATLLYVGIEMISVGAYLLTAHTLRKPAVEAGLKYLIFGGTASAVMLYGFSLLYGASGSLYLKTLLQPDWASDGLLAHIGLAMATGGLLFKIAAVPFHLWAPDVYESVPSPVAAFFSVVPKVAGIGVLMQWSAWIGGESAWPQWLALVSLGSMFLGNASALWQTGAKRMLAYSSIAHAGFLLVPVVSSTGSMGSHTLPLAFYLGVYALMNFAAFIGVQIVEAQNGTDALTAFRGRGREFPLWGGLMVVVALSLVGLPVTAGFTAKLLIFSGLWETYQQSGDSLQFWLLVLGLGNAVIALFYYLKIPYYMFFHHEQSPDRPEMPAVLEFSLLVLSGALLLFFFKPDWLWWH